MAKQPQVSEAAARTVEGCTGGLQQGSVTTTEHAFDVTSWRGRYVKFGAVGDGYYWLFSADSSTTIDASTNRTAFNATVPDEAAAGETQQEVVPFDAAGGSGSMYLIVRAKSGTLTRAWVRPA